jgi:hypothetical protein
MPHQGQYRVLQRHDTEPQYTMEPVIRRRVYRVVFDCPDDTRPMKPRIFITATPDEFVLAVRAIESAIKRNYTFVVVSTGNSKF